jgi:hypothetical protein
LNRFQVREHHAVHPQELGILQDLGDSTDSASLTEPEGFDGYVDPDPITEFKAIHDAPGRRIDANRDPVDIMGFDSRFKNPSRNPEDPQRRKVQPRRFCSPRQGDIDRMWDLGRYSMKRQ